MPTFSTPTPETVPTATAFPLPPTDSVSVLHFREADPSHVEKLNQDLGLSLDGFRFARLQSFFRNSARRDPTVAELKLLDGLDACDRNTPARLAVGELLTDSDAMAATWASMMETHGILHRVGETQRGKHYPVAPPCSLTDALSLAGQYLYRTGLRVPPDGGHAEGSLVLLSTPAQEALAASEGYLPVARMVMEDQIRSLWRRQNAAPPRVPSKTGDFLLYLPSLYPQGVAALLESNAAADRPVLGDIRPVTGSSLLMILTEMCSGIELYADRISALKGTAVAGRLPVELLCKTPEPRSDGAADYILRIPLKRVHIATEILRSLGLTATICGQVRTGERTVIRIRNSAGTDDVPVVELPTAFLRSTAALYLHRYEIPRQVKEPVPPRLLRLARLPSPYAVESGLTPTGEDLTPMTLHEGQVLAIPEADVYLSAVTVTLAEGGNGYASSANAAALATDRLRSVGVEPSAMQLSVSVHVGDASLLTGGVTAEMLCGLYRLAMDREIPVDDPAWICNRGGTGIRLTVVAWGHAPTLRDDPSMPDDAQWRASGALVHKESPLYRLPYLSADRVPALSAVASALNRNEGVGCSLHPLTITEDGSAINEEDVKSLAEALTGWATPVFALSEKETRLLLEQAPIREALESIIEIGYSVVVLGEACRVFAEYGLLPSALRSTHVLPSADRATVTYTSPADAATRLLRAPVLVPQGTDTLPHLLTLHLPDGTHAPDGFTGKGGKVLGLLNGIDTAVLPLLTKLNRGI